jgi:hypothetical protein
VVFVDLMSGSSKIAALALVALVSTLEGRAEAAPRLFTVYAVWMHGEGDADRNALDAFMDCLIERSTFATYYQGAAIVTYAGSFDVAPPSTAVNTQGAGGWVDAAIRAGKVPHAPAGVTPVYLVLGSSASMNMDNTGACGRNAPATVDGKEAGIATVKARPACWNTPDPVRSDTQLSEHEVAEVIDQLLGYWGCSGDGSCEGSSRCGASACSNFTGLFCPGAPATTVTGCNGVSVHGWVVQKLSHLERMPNNCDICTTCDFQVGLGCAGGEASVNQPCTTAHDCCPGLACKAWSYSGQPPYGDACCKDIGATCASGTDCCGGSSCDGASHKCVCVPAGQWCINAGECCTGLTCDLAQSKCVAAPPKPDAAEPDVAIADAGGSEPPPDSSDSSTIDQDGNGTPEADATATATEGDDAGSSSTPAAGEEAAHHRCTCTRTPAHRPLALAIAAALLLIRASTDRASRQRRRR